MKYFAAEKKIILVQNLHPWRYHDLNFHIIINSSEKEKLRLKRSLKYTVKKVRLM